ncbi:MAG: tetratricopeptide repeat protein [Spirochaetia bacterium]|nr:tetratricopeptide repeat protein [Spirochaetia bacterium]
MHHRKIIIFSFFLSSIFIVKLSGEAQLTAQKFKDMADAYRVQKNKLSAVEYYKKSLQKNSQFVPTLVAIGTLMREFGSYPESKEYLQKARKLDPNDKNSLLELIKTEIVMGDIAGSEELLKKGLEQFPQEPDFDFLQAKIYLVKSQYYLAEKKLTHVIRNNPGHLDSHITLGDLYLREKRYQQSRDEFEKARLIDPENPLVFTGLFSVNFESVLDSEGSEIFQKNSDMSIFSDSIDYLLNAKEYDNDYIPANLLLGKIYAQGNKCEKAKQYLDSVLKINPDHIIARYYLGYCFPSKYLEMYRDILDKNQNNEILRYSYERNLYIYSPRRENKYLLDMARVHYDQGSGLFKTHMTNQGVYEMAWAAFLYPSFISAHKELLDHYRNIRDYVKMGDEMKFLKQVTGEVKYQDMYEMLVEKRKEKLHYREKIYRPEEYKTPTPVFVFHFMPGNFLGDFPDAGEALAEKLVFALQETGRVQVLSGSQREEIFKKLIIKDGFGKGIYYNAISGKRVLDYMRQNFTGDSNYIRYAITGSYQEIAEGLDVKAEIIDLETGISFAPFHVKSAGRGFVRDIATKLADHIYQNIPFHGQIIKISSNGVIINLGEREGIIRDTILGVYRDGEKTAELGISTLDTDILWAKSENFMDIYKMQPGDLIKIEKPQKKNANSM